MTRTELVVTVIIVLTLVALLLKPVEAVFDGEYTLTIQVDGFTPSHSSDELVLGYSWTENDFEMYTNGNTSDANLTFRQIRELTPTVYQIEIPYSGKHNVSYHEPEFLVVGIWKENNSKLPPHQLMKFPIPPGRGDRTMAISLP